MVISKVDLSGFRNFKSCTINLEQKSLIIGANDVGKTNFIYALRLLLDRSLSELDIEPTDKDFYAHGKENEFSITIHLSKITEDCLLSKLKDKVSDDGSCVLQYIGIRDLETYEKKFQILMGHNISLLEEIESRFYLKVFNLKFISSRRDLISYIKRERKFLLQDSRQTRDETKQQQDNEKENEIKNLIGQSNAAIKDLSYVKNATEKLNHEMRELSISHETIDFVFDSDGSDIKSYVESLQLGMKLNEQMVSLGGDGRNNQAFLALWASRNKLRSSDKKEVSIFAIEEPEAHLHPHQQRRLAKYLVNQKTNQLILTTHSPQIASEFSPNSLIRFYNAKPSTEIANDGCTQNSEGIFDDFAHRLNLLSVEAFYADIVFLVEGVSEELFYKTYAEVSRHDLDKYNISILNVNGVGFESYINILNHLKIDWVLKTDRDISKVPKKNEFRVAGIERGLSVLKPNRNIDHIDRSCLRKEKEDAFDTNVLIEISNKLESSDIFISQIDLETDLYSSELRSDLEDFYGTSDQAKLIKTMQGSKGINMYNFLKEKNSCLNKIDQNGPILKPFYHCIELAKKIHETKAN